MEYQPSDQCICGRTQKNHKQRDPTEVSVKPNTDWSPSRNTREIPTNAVGTLEFQGTGEGDKAQFIRLSDNTHTVNTIKLLTKEWGLELPKLVITGTGLIISDARLSDDFPSTLRFLRNCQELSIKNSTKLGNFPLSDHFFCHLDAPGTVHNFSSLCFL